MTWIVDRGTSAVPRFTEHADRPGTRGIDAGVRFEATPRYGAPGETWDWTNHSWIQSAAQVETTLIYGIDQERCRRLSVAATDGHLIPAVYAMKRAEVLHYDTLGGAAVAALTIAVKRQRFAFLMAEVDAGGGTLAEVVERVRARFAAMAAVDAPAVVAKRNIRAAGSAAAKIAASKVNWPS